MCPHCHRYQGWMVRKSHVSSIGCLAFLGPFVLAGIPALLNLFFDWTTNNNIWYGLAILGFVLGAILGKLAATTSGPHPDQEDGRCMTDEQLAQHIEHCKTEDYEPFLLWHFSLGNKPGDKEIPVSLGLLDQTNAPVFPEELSTEHALEEVQRG